MIDSENLRVLLTTFDLGTSTAEKDPLLETAKINTQQFIDLYEHDSIDIVKGIKGSGKTALYRALYFLSDYSKDNNLHCIFGIEATGDPVFRQFLNDFDGYSEVQFENFWYIYFVTLIFNHINKDPSISSALEPDDKKDLAAIVKDIGITITGDKFDLRNIISAILSSFRSIATRSVNSIQAGIKTEIPNNNSEPISIMPCIKFDFDKTKKIEKDPIYITPFKNKLSAILNKYNLRIWLMLDRLDEVFPHRSIKERYGLKGILKAAYNFSDPNIRIKTFIREDIISFLAMDGFTAMTHVMDRCSATMTWSKDDIMYLIVKRICANPLFQKHYNIDRNKIDEDKRYREEIFYRIFPSKIGRTSTLTWIYMHCQDGNKVVTPRDIIDYFRFAKDLQINKYNIDPKPQEYLFTEDIIKKSIDVLSKHKTTTYLMAEFPHLKKSFLAFEGNKSTYNDNSLKELLGAEWHKIYDELAAIGFIARVPKQTSFSIPIIWRKGLNLRKGTYFK